MARAAVLGIGNVLMGDDGLGVAALAAFRRRFGEPDGVALIDGGTAGMELLEDIAELDFLLVVDAIADGKEPGSLIHLADEAVPVFFRRNLSPHGIGFSDVLAALEFMGRAPREVVVLGIQPESLDLSLALSPRVAARLPELVGRIAGELATRGFLAASRESALA